MPDEIEVTPEMEAAGSRVIYDQWGQITTYDLAAAIYRAMRALEPISDRPFTVDELNGLRAVSGRIVPGPPTEWFGAPSTPEPAQSPSRPSVPSGPGGLDT